MTAIAIWCNNEMQQNPGLWVVADTRISRANGVLVDSGAKIFSLPVVCRSPGDDGFFSRISWAHSFGYCFAGSTLMGQNSYLGLPPLLSSLVGPDGHVPALADVAAYVQTYLKRALVEYMRLAGSKAKFEVALFGYCQRSSALSAFHFSPKLIDGVYAMSCTSHEQDRMTEALNAAFSAPSVPGRPVSRAPRHVIQDWIKQGSCSSIGGDLQLGIADRFGFRSFCLMKPRVVGQPAAYLSYLGNEITEDLRYVGDACVGLMGMA